METIAATEQWGGTVSEIHWKRPSAANLEGLPSQRLAQLQAVYDGAPFGLGFLDRNLRYVNINGRLAEIHGAPPEHHVGKTIQEMFPHLADRIDPLVRKALGGEGVSNAELTDASDPDCRKTYLVSYQPARDEAGEIIGVSCCVIDFTARKAAEEKLRQFERVVESLDEMIVVLDRDFRHILANRAFFKHYGDPDQIIGRHVADVVDPKVFASVIKPKLDECLQGKPVYYQMKYTFPGLGERDLTISYAPIERAGSIVAIACVLRDVTDWNRMQRQEQNWEKRMELARQSGLRIGFWEWNMDANTVVWSDEAYRQWGFTREQFSGRVEDFVDRIHPDDCKTTQDAMRKAQSGESPEFAVEFRIVRPDGSICWLDTHGVIPREENTRMIGVSVDVTNLKDAQRSLQESEDRYLLLLSSTSQPIYEVDLLGNCSS